MDRAAAGIGALLGTIIASAIVLVLGLVLLGALSPRSCPARALLPCPSISPISHQAVGPMAPGR